MLPLSISRATAVLSAALAISLSGAPPGGRAAVAVPGNPPSWTRSISSATSWACFGRMGCNAGSCHGSFQGKGGFRLSLFGYDPDEGLSRPSPATSWAGASTRSIPTAACCCSRRPARSSTAAASASAGTPGSTSVFREWIAQGRRWTAGQRRRSKSIAVTPAGVCLQQARRDAAAHASRPTFADGSDEDITPFCDFRTNDDAVAEVIQPRRRSRRVRPGDTAIVVSYRGNVVPVRVLVPMESPPGFQYPKVPEVNYIDREVFAKLQRLNMVPSDLSGDDEFLRRVTIDTIG